MAHMYSNLHTFIAFICVSITFIFCWIYSYLCLYFKILVKIIKFVFILPNVRQNIFVFVLVLKMVFKSICICQKNVTQRFVFLHLPKKLTLLDLYLYLGLKILFFTQWKIKDYRITNLHKLVTSYGYVKKWKST